MGSSHDERVPPRSDAAPLTRTRDLVERYLGGDHAAEERLFARFRVALLGRARGNPRMRAIEREVAAEDVVQEVFWRALASGMLRRFEDRGHGSLEAALCRILERTMIDVARRMRAEKRGGSHARLELGTKDENHDGIDRLPSADTTPTGSVRARELVELAGRVLDVREIQVWELIQLEGLDSVEVGERLGISASAVRGVLFRAQSKLVRAIGGELEQ